MYVFNQTSMLYVLYWRDWHIVTLYMLSCEHWTFAEISEATYRLESCEMQWCNSCLYISCAESENQLDDLVCSAIFLEMRLLPVLFWCLIWSYAMVEWLQSVRQRWRSCQKVNCGISKGSSHRKQRGLIIFYLMKHNFLSWDSEWGVRETGCQIPNNGMLLSTLQQFAWWPCKSVMLSSDVKLSFALFVVGRLPLQICQTFFLFHYCCCSFSSKRNEAHIWRSW
jgi:hypothetical protein